MFDLRFEERVATITLQHPPVNAISRVWCEQFHAVLDQLEANNESRVIRITSGLRVFSAGGDIKEFASRLDLPDAGAMLADEALAYQRLFARIEALPQVSVAEIQGVAAGGGMELALACDLRIASTKARLGLPEVGLGLLPSAGGTQRMTRLIGRGRAMRLICGAELVAAGEAFQLGLVEWLFPEEGFAEAARAVANRLAAQPKEALQAAKHCVQAFHDGSRDGYAEEARAPLYLMDSIETRARIDEFVKRSKDKA